LKFLGIVDNNLNAQHAFAWNRRTYARRLGNPKLTEQIRTRCQPFGLPGGYVYSLLL
jgi:hypothetical protein